MLSALILYVYILETNIHIRIFIFLFYREKVFQSTLHKVLKSSRADSTVKKYDNAVDAWRVWCKLFKVECILPDHLDIARYLTYLYNEKAPYSRIESSFYAIKWKLDCSPNIKSNPCDTKFIHLLLDGMKRILARPTIRKEPVTPQMLIDIVRKYDSGGLKVSVSVLCSCCVMRDSLDLMN